MYAVGLTDSTVMSEPIPLVDTDELTVPADIYAAVGQVACSSALLERTVREVLRRMVSGHESSWVIFEGRSLDQMLEDAKAISRDWSAWRDSRPPGAIVIAAFADAIDEARSINQLRNQLIHGVLSPTDTSLGRATYPRGQAFGEPTYYFARSRPRRDAVVMGFTSRGIQQISKEIDEAALNLLGSLEEAICQRPGDTDYYLD